MQELEQILMKRHKEGTYIYELFFRGKMCLKNMYLCCLGQHIFLHHYCLSMSSPHFFLFESGVCKSDKGANSSEIGDP